LKPIKRAPYQLWQSVLNVVLVEGNNLISMDDNGFSDPYVKFKLENEKYRSKTIRRTLNPKYLEQFQFYIYDNDKMNLHISVYDYDAGTNSDDFMGR
jgi:Ca2+-dependent lipid-binding protein